VARFDVADDEEQVAHTAGSGRAWRCQNGLMSPGGDPPPHGFGVELPEFVGRAVKDAITAARDLGIENVIVLESVDGVTVTPRTMDWNPYRLGLIVENETVVRAVFG
jgi:hypothetical protein